MTSAQADRALRDSLDSLVHKKGYLCGATVCYGNAREAVIQSVGQSREVLLTGRGFTEAAKPITAHTIYDLASLTKLFTLVSVLQLVDAGALRLSDSVRSLDSRFARLGEVSVLDCLTYAQRLVTPERVDAQKDSASARAMVFELAPRAHEQGAKLYSDMNALAMKYVIEAASGQGFYEYLAGHVLKPAGMGETFATVPEGRMDDLMDYNHEYRMEDGRQVLLSGALPGLPHDPKARLLKDAPDELSGHAGLFSTAQDLCRFLQALLDGRLLPPDTVKEIGVNRTGYLLPDGEYRQFLGLLCFSRSPLQRLSEVPGWMGLRSFGLSGYTGNHLAVDPDAGVFDILLGNRCHNRLSLVSPEADASRLGLEEDGSGEVTLADGRRVRSSFRFIHQKDRMVHNPVRDCLYARGWMA